jgi:hypothetical protein
LELYVEPGMSNGRMQIVITGHSCRRRIAT